MTKRPEGRSVFRRNGKRVSPRRRTREAGRAREKQRPRCIRVLKISIGICVRNGAETAMPAGAAGIKWGEIEHEGETTGGAAAGWGGRGMCGSVAHG